MVLGTLALAQWATVGHDALVSIKLTKNYTFPEEEALARLRALTDYWSKKYGVKSSWSGTRATIKGKVKGISFEGVVHLDNGRLHADVKAGFLAEKLGAPKYVEGKITDYLDPASSLEALQKRIP